MRNKNKTLSKMHSFSLRLSVYEVDMRAFTMWKLLHRQKGYHSSHTYWPPSALFLIDQQHLEQYCNDILSSAPKMSLLPCRNRPILSWNSHNDAMKVLLYMLLVSISHKHIHIYTSNDNCCRCCHHRRLRRFYCCCCFVMLWILDKIVHVQLLVRLWNIHNIRSKLLRVEIFIER